jgi:hypothetical protein
VNGTTGTCNLRSCALNGAVVKTDYEANVMQG